MPIYRRCPSSVHQYESRGVQRYNIDTLKQVAEDKNITDINIEVSNRMVCSPVRVLSKFSVVVN